MPHPRRTWSERLRRGAIMAAVFVLMGVVTTYLVAWVAVSLVKYDLMWTAGRFLRSEYLESSGRLITVEPRSEIGFQSSWQSFRVDTLAPECSASTFCGLPVVVFVPEGHADSRLLRVGGWPLLCIWGARDEEVLGPDMAKNEYSMCSFVVLPPEHAGPFQLVDCRGIDGRLPLGVVWSRFIPNVLIHAAILFTLWCGVPLAWRSARRRWYSNQHRCPNCGYDRAGLPAAAPCPECGTPGGVGRG